MRIYNVEIPADLTFPGLDEETKAEIDALHAVLAQDRVITEEITKRLRAQGYKYQTNEEIWARKHPNAGPLPEPGVNVEALRKFTPRLRSIFAYIHRHDITY